MDTDAPLHKYLLENFEISQLTDAFISKHLASQIDTSVNGFFELEMQDLDIDHGVFIVPSIFKLFTVSINKQANNLNLICDCDDFKNNLCLHQAQVLFNIKSRKEIRIFFDDRLRFEKLKIIAKDYGLENEENLDDFFQLKFENITLEISPKNKDLFAYTAEADNYLKTNLLPSQFTSLNNTTLNTKMIIVFKNHKYYNHFQIDIFEVETTGNGKIKNPFQTVNPLDLIWKTDDVEEIKFYTAISKFQNNFNDSKPDTDIEVLKALLKNPLNLDFYFHDKSKSETISANTVVPVELKKLDFEIKIYVSFKENFHEVEGQLLLYDKLYELKTLIIRYNYFLFYNNALHLIDDADLLKIILFFKQNNNKILIHQSKFEEFQKNILSNLENKVQVTYSYIKPATHEQLIENNFDNEREFIIYLSDSENYIRITPVIKYGNVEIPIFSKKQIFSRDQNGNVFLVDRDEELEVGFSANIMRQHPDFEEQMNNSEDFFYLHRHKFLDETWFLDAFEEWKIRDIKVLGFNELKNNRINPNKVKISILVNSGLNWFDTDVDVRFGNQRASLKHLHKSLRNKNKFVELGDGTLGILPQEWIDKFSTYLNSGEIFGECIRTSKSNFAIISDLYEDQVLSEEVKNELNIYHSKIINFKKIEDVEIPEGLQANLRDYQKEGLNWMNFLDEFNFGGCLADDMGLGKTIQVIAFILLQRSKRKTNNNLVVVPTTLIFNWQAELKKFAPSIKVLTIYGSTRVKDVSVFDNYEIILTSYGTLLSDIMILKKYNFNYIFLDESQNIKNPESLRYQAVRLLQSRNKIILTGTPIENNTFDLYAQLSFACPGLLGNKRFFRDQYAIPIDQFKEDKKAVELQKKINPFILRRTKNQVLAELPDKTEMIIYCEMGAEQRKVYETYKKEFKDFVSSESATEIEKRSMYVLKGLTVLRQVCNSPASLKDDPSNVKSSSKMDVLMEEIENKSPHHKILIFSQFVTMLDLIEKELKIKEISYQYLTGKTKNRSEKVEEFQNYDKVRVFLISLKAGGVGLNLTEADYVYIVDPWWNPAVEDQAIDRCYRIGQKKNIVAVRLICPDTIEEKILKLKETKRELVGNLIKTDTSILKSLSKKDWIEIFN